MASIPPGTLILLGALVVPFLTRQLRQYWCVVIPILSFLHLTWAFGDGTTQALQFFGQDLTPIRVDRLSLVWGYVFHIAAILAAIYAWRTRDRVEHMVAMLYVGASIGAIFAGDLMTLFVYWELTAVSSVFLIWAGKSKHAFGAGIRYVLMHVASGVLVLSGALLVFTEHGSLSFGAPGATGMFHELADAGSWCLLLGFGIKAAFPLLHCWLPDAYPESTATGTVYLSAFTTKMAIYALARGFAHCELLIMVGAVMAIFPLIQAVLASDMRQTLSHVLNNQLGFMVVAIGVGSELAINGVAAQAFAHVLYKGLLFMAMGAVLVQAGSACQTKLGGLARRMPWTCAFCLVGALSVVPLNCGFVTKALVLNAVAEEHLDWIWLALMVGAVGAFVAAGIKVPYFTFFAAAQQDQSRVEQAPLNMKIAMGTAAAMCLAIGVFPSVLYGILPFEGDYHPYTTSHVVHQLQLISFSTLGFILAVRFGVYPKPVTGTLLDFDWFYRRPTQLIRRRLSQRIEKPVSSPVPNWYARFDEWMSHQCSESGIFGRSVSTNAMAVSAIILLAVYLLIYY